MHEYIDTGILVAVLGYLGRQALDGYRSLKGKSNGNATSEQIQQALTILNDLKQSSTKTSEGITSLLEIARMKWH